MIDLGGRDGHMYHTFLNSFKDVTGICERTGPRRRLGIVGRIILKWSFRNRMFV
jgi:hypothetical protein